MARRSSNTASTVASEGPRALRVRLACRLQQLRRDRELTLTDLAERAHVSQAFLSRIENHKASLSLDTLERLATALDVPVSSFFEGDLKSMPVFVCRANEGSLRHMDAPRNVVVRMLAGEKHGKLMEPMIVDLGGPTRDARLSTHSGDEFNYVLHGSCTLKYGGERIALQQGDAVYFDASVPHLAVRNASERCVLLAIIASRDVLFHGELKTLLREWQA